MKGNATAGDTEMPAGKMALDTKTAVRDFGVSALVAVALPILYALYAFDVYSVLRELSVGAWWQSGIGGGVVLICAITWWYRSGPSRSAMLPLVAAAILIGAALAWVDSRYPAKYIHVPEYTLLGMVLMSIFRRYANKGVALLLAINVVLLAAVMDESFQGYLPTRTFGLDDFIVDGLAGTAGCLIAMARRGDDTGHAKIGIGTLLLCSVSGVSAMFLAYAFSRFSDVGLNPAIWLMVPLLASIAAICGAALIELNSRSEARVAVIGSGMVIATLCLVTVGIHVVSTHYPVQFR